MLSASVSVEYQTTLKRSVGLRCNLVKITLKAENNVARRPLVQRLPLCLNPIERGGNKIKENRSYNNAAPVKQCFTNQDVRQAPSKAGEFFQQLSLSQRAFVTENNTQAD